MNTYFPFQILGIVFHGSFDALGGTARNLATLIRTGDCTLDINSAGAVVVSGHLGLTVIHVSNLSALISVDRKKVLVLQHRREYVEVKTITTHGIIFFLNRRSSNKEYGYKLVLNYEEQIRELQHVLQGSKHLDTIKKL